MSTPKRRKLSTILLFVVAGAFLPLAIAVPFLVGAYERAEALTVARSSAERLIERNLAIHRYFAQQLKPAVFALAGETLPEGYFEPHWMSSTHAIHVMQGYLEKFTADGFYYKECAIDARSPENEADPFEREFLERSARDPGVAEWSGVREIEGRPYFVVLLRGESMEESCLLCHSDPARAPSGLVQEFGPVRSFGRVAGELVSALSVRIPLHLAYQDAVRSGWRLALSLWGAMAFTLLLFFLLGRRYVTAPLATLRRAVIQINRDEERLGQPLDTGGSREIQDVADAFVALSARVKHHLDELETEVVRRTGHLEEANAKLLAEMAERSRAETALSASEARYRSLFVNMTEAFALHEVICDAQGRVVDYRFLDVNPAFEKETGLTKDHVVGNTQSSVLPGEDPHWVETYGKVALTGEPVHLTRYSSVLDRHYDVYAFQPKPLQFAALFRDVSAQWALEDQLRQSQKLEAIGTLAGGIAHDFNNILAAVMGYTELSLMKLSPGDEVRENLQEVLVSANRAKELVQQLLTVGQPGDRRVVPVDVHWVVGESLRQLATLLPKNVTIEQQLGAHAGHTLADPTELHQVVMNLYTNAYQAMLERGGTLTVRLRKAEVGPQEASRVAGLVPGHYLRLDVEDSGEGMDSAMLEKIFEPYFTTKGQDSRKGRGLGLAMVRSLVLSRKGAIAVHSTPGVGTVFTVYLPEHVADPQATSEAPSRGLLPGKGTVLFVDDEPGLARLGRKLFESLGYRVRETVDPVKALHLIERDPQGFDLLVTDQTMPGLTGVELVRRARLARPGLPAVLCTGHTDRIDAAGARELGIAAFIHKPYDRNQLGAAAAAALAEDGR